MERYLDNNGTKLWSIATGAGTPLILCNGGPGCDDYLAPVSEMIDDLYAADAGHDAHLGDCVLNKENNHEER